MKRIAVLLVLLVSVLFVVSGCGHGGRSNAASTGQNGGTTGGDNGGSTGGNDTATPGFISIIFTQGASNAQSLRSISTATANLIGAPSARVAIRKVDIVVIGADEFTGDPIFGTVTTYKKVVDISTAGTTTIAVAPGTGYTVDVITSRVSTATTPTHNSMLQYGLATNVTVTGGQRNDLSISLSPINAALLPATPTAESSLAAVGSSPITTNYFTVAYNTTGFPLRAEKNLRVSGAGVLLTGLYEYNPSLTSFTAAAPILNVGDGDKAVDLQGLFFLDDDHLNTGENYTAWRYYEPNYPDLLDSHVTITILQPGGVGAVITGN
jgi:hypothetical protein